MKLWIEINGCLVVFWSLAFIILEYLGKKSVLFTGFFLGMFSITFFLLPVIFKKLQDYLDRGKA